jgi:hypothetical protein
MRASMLTEALGIPGRSPLLPHPESVRWGEGDCVPIAIPVVKLCPACSSEKTAICARSGLQRLLGLARRLRKYRCLDCGRLFRAADRRRYRRTGQGARVINRPSTPGAVDQV